MLVSQLHGHTLILGLVALMSVGCNNGSNTDMTYKAAINDHFKAFPVCIWSQPKKFPVQAATSDDAKTEGYDALTQEGLLTRTTAEKKVLIVASKKWCSLKSTGVAINSGVWETWAMANNRTLLKHSAVGGISTSYRCSQCGRIFPVPGTSLTDQQKADKVQAEFNNHNCKEDASQAAARIVREATSRD